jgi:hypothetical protein
VRVHPNTLSSLKVQSVLQCDRQMSIYIEGVFINDEYRRCSGWSYG